MAMSALIKSLEDIMRKDAGLNGDAQYIEQITWLLFLKAFDAKEMEWEFRPDYQGVIPEGLRWRDWAEDKEGITGDALIAFGLHSGTSGAVAADLGVALALHCAV